MISGGPAPQPRHETVAEMIAHAASSGAVLTFVDAQEHESRFTWAQLCNRARRVAGALADLGVAEGDRVAIVLPTSVDFCDAFFGAILAGAVPVPLYPPVRLGRLDEYHRATARMVEGVGAEIVLTDARVGLMLGEVAARAKPKLGVMRVSELRERGSELERSRRADDLALIQFSSGSTVDPKPVALTHGNLLSQCAVLKALFPEVEGVAQCGVSWLPLYHDMGLIGALLQAPYYPGPLVLLPPEAFLLRPALWLRAISRCRATISPAPNFAYGLCLKRISDVDMTGLDLSSWAYALNGAEPVSLELMRRFAERFSRCGFRAESLMPVYGLSEAALAVSFSPRRAPPREMNVDAQRLGESGRVQPGPRALASVGSPIPGVDLEIRDEQGVVLGELRQGRIWVRGPSVMHGYFQNEAATSRALSDGWLDTGDLGFVSEGELFISGRSKDLVIIRGANHAPQEFEDCLVEVDGLRAGCAVAVGHVPDGQTEEQLVLLAEWSDRPSPARLDALLETIRERVLSGTGIRPHEVRLLAPGTLPRTSSGKLRRGEALRRYVAGELEPPQKVTAVTIAGAVAQSLFGYAKAKLDPS